MKARLKETKAQVTSEVFKNKDNISTRTNRRRVSFIKIITRNSQISSDILRPLLFDDFEGKMHSYW